MQIFQRIKMDTTNLQIINIYGKSYYDAIEVHKLNEKIFGPIGNRIRRIVGIKNINEKDYIFAYLRNDKYVVSHADYTKAKLFLSCDWVNSFVDISYCSNNRKNQGYVYIVTAPTIDHIKIGFSTGSLYDLKKRYKTYYTGNAQYQTFETIDPRSLEKQCHEHFKKYRINKNTKEEIFEKEHLDKYVKYLKEHCKCIIL
jgi:hypothetical protein